MADSGLPYSNGVNVVNGFNRRVLRHERERALSRTKTGIIIIAGIALIAGAIGGCGGYSLGQRAGIEAQQQAFAATANELIIQPASLPESQAAFKASYPGEQVMLGYRSPADVFITASGRTLVFIGGAWIEITMPTETPEYD